MEVDEIKVPCPFCKKTMYRRSRSQHGGSGDAIYLNSPDAPQVENDKNGFYLTCPHCLKRIVMLPKPEHPNAGYDVSPDQQW